jgi:hypothetical protein
MSGAGSPPGHTHTPAHAGRPRPGPRAVHQLRQLAATSDAGLSAQPVVNAVAYSPQ